ncbi:phosphoribosylamine--glycine ligase [[Synechococcus] sp. NIES-970]|uniref:phosphoribosylamine--glycine ligase n=1 Tax=Picosynechococcus sp. NKBG15041c TaxID=1407650 RepID=UPI00040A0F3A|nr:phosphoribosylamine--glycine ligase [Picosynechococcus sp. NKBG15041c]BAW96612.1 phosphoribosylamine--glycine ligase [[Synechococcus] sp. NIES-970]
MNVLVVGNGGREHAIAWKLLQSPNVEKIVCTPGNGGTALLENCQNLPIAVDDFAGIAQACRDHHIDFVAVGPEVPLSLGLADFLNEQNIPVFGPQKDGAIIEASKAWAKELMIEAGVPTAASGTFTDPQAAKDYIESQGAPIVVKADSLAAGKGVIVAETLEEALNAVDRLWAEGYKTLVVEEFLVGQEVSVLALTDGKTIRPLLPSQDHKQIGEGDTGENTGGMGVYAPTPIATPEIMAQVQTDVLEATLKTLQKRGIDYRGILYAGLMVSPSGVVKVLEFNCRFGDPETQAILPLLETPLDELMLACINQTLATLPPLKWYAGSAVCVVAASAGYPGTYEKGKVITGLQEAEALGATVFHAGTKLEGDTLLTDGGRVLGIVCRGENFDRAIANVYQAVPQVQFPGMYYRRDIGHRLKKA